MSKLYFYERYEILCEAYLSQKDWEIGIPAKKLMKKKFVDFTLSLMFAVCQQIVLFHHKFSPQRLHECLEISFKQSR